jgi:uncharacterized membrane protein
MTAARRHLHPARPLHPLYAVLIAGSLPLFLGAFLSDWAYASSYEIQWTNFASWLVAGALVFCGFALLFAIVDTVRTAGRGIVFALIVLATFLLGLVNAFVHAKDAWAAMPAGLILSFIVAALALIATWFGFASLRRGEST